MNGTCGREVGVRIIHSVINLDLSCKLGCVDYTWVRIIHDDVRDI